MPRRRAGPTTPQRHDGRDACDGARPGLDQASARPQRRRRGVTRQQRPGARVVQSGAKDPLQRRADREQHVAQPVRRSVHVVGQVIVVAANHAQPLERLVVALEPVQPPRVGARGVRQHEAVAAVGLRLPGVVLRGAAHDQPRHLGDRHPAPARDADRQRADRARLVDHQCAPPDLAGTVEQPLDLGLVVRLSAGSLRRRA